MKKLILLLVFAITFSTPVFAEEVLVAEEEYFLVETNEEIDITETITDDNLEPTEFLLDEVDVDYNLVTSVTEEEYLANVDSFNQLTMSEVYDLFDSDRESRDTLYLGRPTCPHCREFSPILKEFNELIHQNLLYYNTDSDDLDDEARAFLFETLGVPGVPTLLYIENGLLTTGWVGGGVTAQELYEFFYSESTSPLVNDDKEIDFIDSVEKHVLNYDKVSLHYNTEKFEATNTINQKVVSVSQERNKFIEHSIEVTDNELPNTGDSGIILVVIGIVLITFSITLYRYN